MRNTQGDEAAMFITQALKRSAQLYSDRLATVCQGRERTWSEVEARVAKFAGALRKLGVENGERVAILSLNSDRYYEYFFATPWAGGVFVPINIRLAPPEVAFWLNDSGSEILLIDDRFVPIIDELERQLETVRDVIYVGEGDAPDGMRHIEDLIEAADPLKDAMRGNDDLAGLFYTGGTTGRSKGVMLSHANLVFNNMNCIHTFNYSQGMRWLHACPIFHIAGGIAIFGVTQVAGTHVSIPAYAPDVTAETI
jgi:long-chain acyl-CoA synthetase